MTGAPGSFAYVQSKATLWLKMPEGVFRAQDPLQLADADWPQDRLRPLMEQLAMGKGGSTDTPLSATDIADVYQTLLTLHLEPRGVRSSLRASHFVDCYECEHAVTGARLTVFVVIPGATDQ